MIMNDNIESLPGLDCGMCGVKTCEQFAEIIREKPEERKRCVQMSRHKAQTAKAPASLAEQITDNQAATIAKDSLGREVNFILDKNPEDIGPRETIIPHNPMLTREMDIKKGDVLIGRPLGMSCGCPVAHSGIVMDVDHRTGVITWCVTGPLMNRGKPIKDLGYYSAQAYEGIVKDTAVELKIGMRYWYLPRRCMLQWRHSGTVIYMNRVKEGTRVRIEGIMIG
jgi:uncharacterized Fe-S cluster-containing protein